VVKKLLIHIQTKFGDFLHGYFWHRRASTILNRNVKLFGPMNALYTTVEDSCWNSDQAPSETSVEEQQTFTIIFNRKVKVKQLKIMFQGGFAPQRLQAYSSLNTSGNGNFKLLMINDDEVYEPTDSSQLEDIPLEECECSSLKLVMGESTDFYGRITVYKVEVWGEEC